MFNNFEKEHVVSHEPFNKVKHKINVINYRGRKCGKRLGQIICVCFDLA